jgi:N-acetyl-gamma-glutamyl-phosphate reductase
MVRIGIIGATGYTGAELVRLLVGHPQARITMLTSESYVGQAYCRVYPSFSGLVDAECEPLEVGRVAEKSDLVFTALPHTKAMGCVPPLLESGKKVIDLSADFRLQDSQVYEAWYAPHAAPHLLRQAVYGLPELHRESLRTARLVANPGCYPTSAVLAAAPLLQNGWVDPRSLIVNAASGVTGAGRSVSLGNLFCEVNEGVKAYKVGEHRHTPEMEQEMTCLAGAPIRLTFTPHLVPLSRGILTTLYANLVEALPESRILEAYKRLYGEEPFVRVLPASELPNVRDVRGTNFCQIGLKVDERTGRIIVLSAIDNLGKGAAGQAVQNMNLIMGYPETTGLTAPPLMI